MEQHSLSAYAKFRFEHGAFAFDVYRRGAGPGPCAPPLDERQHVGGGQNHHQRGQNPVDRAQTARAGTQTAPSSITAGRGSQICTPLMSSATAMAAVTGFPPHYIGGMISDTPPMYGRRTSGTTKLPLGCW